MATDPSSSALRWASKLLFGVTLLEGPASRAIGHLGHSRIKLQSRGQKPLEFVAGGLLLFVAAACMNRAGLLAPICRVCWKALSSLACPNGDALLHLAAGVLGRQ